jgi:hypothetical protein
MAAGQLADPLTSVAIAKILLEEFTVISPGRMKS